MIKKLGIHFLGVVFIPLGVAMIVNAQIGAFPWDGINLFMFSMVQSWWPEVNLWMISFFNGTLMAILAVILYRKPKYFVSIIMILFTSLFFELFYYLLGTYMPYHEQLYFAIPMALLGMVVMAIGINFTILSGLIASAIELVMMFIDKKVHNLFLAKLILEGSLLIISITLGIITGDLWLYVNWFTVIAILTVSTFVSMTYPLVALMIGKKGHLNENK